MQKVDESKDQVFEGRHEDAVAVHERETKETQHVVVAEERLEHSVLLVPLEEAELHHSVTKEPQVAQSEDHEPLELEWDHVEVEQHVQVTPHLLLSYAPGNRRAVEHCREGEDQECR